MRRQLRFCAIPLAFTPVPGLSQEPLNIEQLLVAESSWQAVGAAAYRSERNPLGVFSEREDFSAALRYGFGPRLELNAQLRSGRRAEQSGTFRRSDEYRGVALGANWLLKAEDDWPALLIEAGAQVYSSLGRSSRLMSAGDIVLTAYRSVDPVVLSVTAAFAVQRDFAEAGARVSPGYSWSLAPQVNFAVNHRVTLIGGLSFLRREATRINGFEAAAPTEHVGFRLGMGFALEADDTVFIVGDFTSDSLGGGLSVQWLHVF